MRFDNHDCDGNTLHYVSGGHGPVVVLLHGLAASLNDWEFLLPSLVESGYQAYAVDLPGHGESDKPGNPDCYTISQFSGSIERWLVNLGIQDHYILIGHSLGGYISLSLALQHPEQVRGLVLINPFFNLQQVSPFLRALSRRLDLGIRLLDQIPQGSVDRLMRWNMTPLAKLPFEARQRIAVDLKRASPNILRLPFTTQNLTSELERVKVPTLVIWGDRDHTLKPSSFHTLVANLPQGAGYPMSGMGHHPHIGRPEEVNPLILNFMSKLSG